MKNKYIAVLYLVVVILSGCKKDNAQAPLNVPNPSVKYEPLASAPGVVLGTIYRSSLFSAFTDIVNYNNEWFVVFREGTKHAGGTDGVIKVLVSTDGYHWQLNREIRRDSVDLRDPKLVLDTASNELFVTFFGRDKRVGASLAMRNYYTRYSEQDTPSEIVEINNEWPGNDKFCLWKWTMHGSDAYCLGYRLTGYNDTITNLVLVNSDKRFSKLRNLSYMNLRGQPSECTIRFDENNKMYLVVRAEGASFYIGSSEKPYTSVKWYPNEALGRLASPNFLLYKSYLLITGRDLVDWQFKFFVYDLAKKAIVKELVFKSGIEVGYGGMSYNPSDNNEIWISYYCIENSGSNIYLAKMDLNKVFK